MSVGERDPLTGHMTTGHEWNGIKELNTPVPWPVWFFLIATALFGIVYWVLMPAWPTGRSYTKGLLGADARSAVTEKVRQAQLERSEWTRRIAGLNYAAIQADPQLMQAVRERGHALFGDNCAACHGANARGGPGYPDLTDQDWLWGGTPDAIAHTIAFGINNGHAEGRVSQMLAFGRDQILTNDQVLAVTDYVRSLSDPAVAKSAARSVAAGKAVFDANCTVCHGDNGRGNQALGAPDLTDKAWIFGGDANAIYTSIHGGRQGEMPAWNERLSDTDRKILTLYVLDRSAAK
ncbi:cytochrome-c oxidase, cbb3-type subunit III [Sphingomonas flavalba]|uniref:cytochrome-c oxidase, cbb3-type subunit III n=1 Tax=Sphingomonas flavalba TaxID=2559804 RepID=UPI0039E08E1B